MRVTLQSCGREGRESCGLCPGGPRLWAGCDYHSVRPGCAVRFRSTGPRHMSWRRACGRQLRLPALGRVLCAAEETKLGPKWASGAWGRMDAPLYGPAGWPGPRLVLVIRAGIRICVYVCVLCVTASQRLESQPKRGRFHYTRICMPQAVIETRPDRARVEETRGCDTPVAAAPAGGAGGERARRVSES